MQPDPHYTGFFECFNSQRYYEAHDVLEELWLETAGPERDFYKGLIQVAGAFVHLRLHREHPGHPKHRARLRPAARLLLRAADLLGPYAPSHMGLDVAGLRAFCRSTAAALERSRFAENPWDPSHPPSLRPGHGPARQSN